ncbi:LEPR-XLL domain-containing protein [Fibrobacter sp.]
MKKIKKSVKQSTKNNYRIEALEPRLMMNFAV